MLHISIEYFSYHFLSAFVSGSKNKFCSNFGWQFKWHCREYLEFKQKFIEIFFLRMWEVTQAFSDLSTSDYPGIYVSILDSLFYKIVCGTVERPDLLTSFFYVSSVCNRRFGGKQSLHRPDQSRNEKFVESGKDVVRGGDGGEIALLTDRKLQARNFRGRFPRRVVCRDDRWRRLCRLVSLSRSHRICHLEVIGGDGSLYQTGAAVMIISWLNQSEYWINWFEITCIVLSNVRCSLKFPTVIVTKEGHCTTYTGM